MQNQILHYIGENTGLTAAAILSVFLFFLLLVFVQVTRTRREAHEICKKIQGYLDVVFAEDEPEVRPEEVRQETAEIPVYQTIEDSVRAQEAQKEAEDARLLMEVISEIF